MDNPESEETVNSLFVKGLELHDRVVDGEAGTEEDVRKAVMMLEDVTRMVSALDLFSKNEDIKEVPTAHVKFLLLPFLLGNLNAKLSSEVEQRLEVIRVVQTYYMDFLRRIKDYGIIQHDLPAAEDEDCDRQGASKAVVLAGPPSRPNLAKMNAEREQKLARYKEKKELEGRVKELRSVVHCSETEGRLDEEAVRDFYLSLIRSSALTCLDEITSFQMEKPILAHMAKVRSGQAPPPQPKPSEQSRRPLKPIIITKDRVQKEVFGMGYKNLPILSIEEFYEQRVRDGWFPSAEQVKENSLMDRANQDPEVQLQQAEDAEAEKEKKEDEDDEEELARKRAWDDWKDDHKRGEGNMHNKG